MGGGGRQGDKHASLAPSTLFVLPPVPFCKLQLSSASRLFLLSNFLMTDVTRIHLQTFKMTKMPPMTLMTEDGV